VWPEILSAATLSLTNLMLSALAAAGLARILPRLANRAAARAPFWGGTAVLGIALLGLLVTAVAQIAVWATAFMLCGEFADFETAFYHSSVNFTTLGYGDVIMSRQWRLLGPLEASASLEGPHRAPVRLGSLRKPPAARRHARPFPAVPVGRRPGVRRLHRRRAARPPARTGAACAGVPGGRFGAGVGAEEVNVRRCCYLGRGSGFQSSLR
jgi:hypothetical protein